MRRRDILKQLGTTTAVVAGGAGAVSADTARTVEWEFADGSVEQFTLAEFDDHPETPTVAEIRESKQYELRGCCSCGPTGDMSCPGCLIICHPY